jgi:hypothetical protein
VVEVIRGVRRRVSARISTELLNDRRRPNDFMDKGSYLIEIYGTGTLGRRMKMPYTSVGEENITEEGLRSPIHSIKWRRYQCKGEDDLSQWYPNLD